MTGTGGVTAIIIPQPTVNGPLHVGHLSGPYLAADIASRAARARGEHVVTLASVDVHPNYVLTRAETLGEDVEEMVTRYRAQIMSAFGRARIGYDVFVDPADASYQRAIVGLLNEMVANGSVLMEEFTLYVCADCDRTMHHSYVVGKCPACGAQDNGTSCEDCGGFTSAATLIDPSCARCGGVPRPMVATVPVLRLEDYRERLTAEWLQAEWTTQVRSVFQRYQHEPLPTIPLAYPTNWGIECDGPLAGMRLDFMAEVGLCYLYGLANAVNPEVSKLSDYLAAWERIEGLWQFYGIDNAFYFTILVPAILAAAGIPTAKLLGAGVNQFYLLDGSKFSTSRNHALWADEFLQTHDVELVRLYLSWTRPDRFQSNFTDDSYQAFVDWVRPLLENASRHGGAPAVLAQSEIERAEQALRLSGFDPALAVRCLLTALSTGSGRDSTPLNALTGRAWPAANHLHPTSGES